MNIMMLPAPVVLISLLFSSIVAKNNADKSYIHTRVMLCIDASGSMCENFGPGNCCVPGDSSGMCSKNDSENKRIEGAHLFIDSLRACDPESEVGVITFVTTINHSITPLVLNSDANISRLHEAIEDGACSPDPVLTESNGDVSTFRQLLLKKNAITTTNLGKALERALEEVDTDYNDIADEFSRHIILLTDGAWDDLEVVNPPAIIDEYTTTHPDRMVPVVHGIFIFDSVTHVQHGYPPEGCAGENTIDLEPLQNIAEFTGGMYFSGSTPQSIINAFNLDLCLKSTVSEKPADRHHFNNILRYHPEEFQYPLYDLSGREVTSRTGNRLIGSPVSNGIYLFENEIKGRKVLLLNRE